MSEKSGKNPTRRTRPSGRPSGALSGWVYGANPVNEALRAGLVKCVYVHSGRRKGLDSLLELANSKGVKVQVMHDAGFFDSRFAKGHQGVAAEMEELASCSVDDMLGRAVELGEAAFIVVLDGIEDPRNLGAILRSAEAAGAHGAVMEKRRSAPIGAETIKASAGAALHLPVAVVSNIKHSMRQMQQQGVTLVGAEAGSPTRPVDVDMSGAVALVMGSEGSGLRRTVKEACDYMVSLPIRGKVNSLNASVASGIMLYEVLRQRGF